MAEQTLPMVETAGGAASRLAALITQLGATPHLRLFQSSFHPTPVNVRADFVAAEATFTGYPAGGILLVPSAVGIDAQGIPTSLTNRGFFQATDAVAPNMIGGFWVEDSSVAPTPYPILFCIFPNPLPLIAALAFLAIMVALQEPGTGYAIVDN